MKVQILKSLELIDLKKRFWQFYINAEFQKAILSGEGSKSAEKALMEVMHDATNLFVEKFFEETGDIQISLMNITHPSQNTVSFMQDMPSDSEIELEKFGAFIKGFLCGLSQKSELTMMVDECDKTIFSIFKKRLNVALTRKLGKDKFEIQS